MEAQDAHTVVLDMRVFWKWGRDRRGSPTLLEKRLSGVNASKTQSKDIRDETRSLKN